MYLKRYVHGIALCVASASAIYYIVSAAVTMAFEVAEKIQSQGNVSALDMTAITDLVSQQSSGTEQPMNIATAVFVVCWVIGIVDSYYQGRTQEKAEQVEGEKER
jgi:uncharacterized membrane protein